MVPKHLDLARGDARMGREFSDIYFNADMAGTLVLTAVAVTFAAIRLISCLIKLE